MNLVWAGDFYADPEVLLPGVAGKRNLQRMYDHVAPYIRQHDERHMIFYEPVTWGMITDNQIVGSGFDHVPGGTEYADRSAFSYHYYCDSFVPSYADKPVLTKVVCDEAIAPLVWRAVQEETARLGGGAMMTEGMACDFSKNESARECEAVLAQLDAHLLSFTDYGVSQGATFEPIPQQQEGWARTHAQAIAGTPLNMTFDPTTKDFEFCFTPDASLTVPTIIFASLGYSYPTGRHITTTPNLEVVDAAAASEGDLIAVTPARDAAPAVACVWVSRS